MKGRSYTFVSNICCPRDQTTNRNALSLCHHHHLYFSVMFYRIGTTCKCTGVLCIQSTGDTKAQIHRPLRSLFANIPPASLFHLRHRELYRSLHWTPSVLRPHLLLASWFLHHILASCLLRTASSKASYLSNIYQYQSPLLRLLWPRLHYPRQV